MKTVKLIRDLVVDEVPYMGPGEVQLYRTPPIDMVHLGDGGMTIASEIHREQCHIIPLSRIINRFDMVPVRKDIYVAFSSTVEELIGVPINTIYRELEECRASKDRQRIRINELADKVAEMRMLTATRWDRLKFWWGGFDEH